MSNMSYCRFQNTEKDLRECYEDFGSPELSKEEQEARKKLYKLCQKIVDNFDIDEI